MIKIFQFFRKTPKQNLRNLTCKNLHWCKLHSRTFFSFECNILKLFCCFISSRVSAAHLAHVRSETGGICWAREAVLCWVLTIGWRCAWLAPRSVALALKGVGPARRWAWLAPGLARARPAPASCGGRGADPRHTLIIAPRRKVWRYRLSLWWCIPAGVSPILASFFPSSPGESVPLLDALLCHFFGRVCATFGSDFVSLFWTNL